MRRIRVAGLLILLAMLLGACGAASRTVPSLSKSFPYRMLFTLKPISGNSTVMMALEHDTALYGIDTNGWNGLDPVWNTTCDQFLLIASNGTQDRTLLSDGKSVGLLVKENVDQRDPIFSPDGIHVALQAFDGIEWKIVLATTSGETIGTLDRPSFNTQRDPVFSPDGRYLAFVARDGIHDQIYLWDVLRGGEPTKFFPQPMEQRDPVWSPDGDMLAFVTTPRTGTYQIAVVSFEKEVKVLLDETNYEQEDPTWSPNGTWIAFTDHRQGVAQIYVTNIQTGETQPIARSQGAQEHPKWSPDSRYIGFTGAGGAATRLYLFDVRTGAVSNLTTANNTEWTEADIDFCTKVYE